MSHTDPQEDTPCRDCKRPTQHDTERCDDCRTPAGRLVTALREIAPQIEDVTQDGESVVSIGCLTIEIDDDGCWSINGHEDDGVTIARAAAAVVDHAGTIASLAAERDTLAARVAELEAHNGRMVAYLLSEADDLDSDDHALDAAALRDLAGGAS